MFGAGNVEAARSAGAGGHKNGVESAVEKIVDGEIPSDCGGQVKNHSEVFNLADFAAYHLFRQTVFRYAVHEYAARFGFHFENLHAETAAREVARSCESGRPAAYHGHAPTRFLGYCLVGQARVGVEIGHEAFEFTYVYMAPLLAEHAVALALTLVGAHAAAHCREVAAGVDDRHGIAEIALGKFGNPVGDVVGEGAAFAARRHLAVKAALRFADGLSDCVAFGYFSEVVLHYFISR